MMAFTCSPADFGAGLLAPLEACPNSCHFDGHHHAPHALGAEGIHAIAAVRALSMPPLMPSTTPGEKPVSC